MKPFFAEINFKKKRWITETKKLILMYHLEMWLHTTQTKITLDDFNVGVEEPIMSNFYSIYDVKSLIRANLFQKPR